MLRACYLEILKLFIAISYMLTELYGKLFLYETQELQDGLLKQSVSWRMKWDVFHSLVRMTLTIKY